MRKNKSMYKRYGETINYIIFGALTTLVNFVVYFFFYNVLSTSNVFSNIIAWAISATFAFVVNKLSMRLLDLIFYLLKCSSKVTIKELAKTFNVSTKTI